MALDASTIIIVAVVIIALIVIVWVIGRKRRTDALRRRFGPEYERTVREKGPNKAETVLLERKQRVEKFSIRALSASEREPTSPGTPRRLSKTTPLPTRSRSGTAAARRPPKICAMQCFITARCSMTCCKPGLSMREESTREERWRNG